MKIKLSDLTRRSPRKPNTPYKDNFRDLVPPQHTMRPSGPETHYAESIRNQLTIILNKHEIALDETLLTDLIKWRRA